jgi:lysophospholipase L1-like esterase
MTVTASGGDGGSADRTSGQTIQACDGITAVAGDGTVYAPVSSTPNPYATWIQRYDLVANQGGAQRWSAELSTTCGNVWNFPSSVVIGSDGNVYVVAGSGGACSTGTRLIGFNASDGTVLFNKPLGNSGGGRYNGLLPYSSGLVVWWGSQFRYFDYSGNEQTPVNITLSSSESVADVAGGTGGTVLAMVVKNQSPNNNCPYGQVASRVLASNGSGQVWQYSVLDCQQYLMFRSTPSNGAVFGGTNAAGVDQLTAIKSDGSLAWANPYQPDSGDDGAHVFIGSRHFNTSVDNNGNVVVLRWYHSEDNQYQGAQVSIVDGVSGDRRSVIYTSDLDSTKSFDVQPTNIGLSAGRLYIVATTCISGTCSSGDPYLYAVQVPILGMDFPRAATLGQISQPPTAELKYVALGDSYASGEGVPPFDEGTDVGPAENDFNMCHRSPLAYSHLLSDDSSLDVGVATSVACSGATTSNVINTYQYGNQPPQTLLLNSGVDVVTVSIGGNDVGFSTFAISCVDPQTSCEGTSYDTIVSNITNDLPDALDAAYAAIKAKVSTTTKVVVVGYPQLIPAANVSTTWPFCQYLTSTEKTNARNVVSLINGAVAAAVGRAGSQFVFADPTAAGSPFTGHELCNDGSYFNGVTVQDSVLYATAYSFHPNAAGQRAYWQVVRPYMS